jgi:hypothetical protein
MARGIVYIDGIDDVLLDFDKVVADIEIESKIALNESLGAIELKMKANAASMLNKGYATGRMVESIGHHVGKTYDGVITSSVGVYTSGVKDPKRRVPATVLALMYEAGIRPHSTASGARLAHSTGRKEKGQTGKLHRGSPIIPFMSSAFDAGSIDIFENIKNRLNSSIER